MKFKLKGHKHYYIYQNDKKVGTLTHKHNEITINNNSPILVRTNPVLREIIYYTVLIGLCIPIAIFAFPALSLLFLFGSFILDPMELNSKVNFYIPRPTGVMELTSDKNYKTNANVIVRHRIQFLHIRFTFLQLCFLNLLISLFWMAFKHGVNYPVLGMACIYAPIYFIIVWISVKKYKNAVYNYKLEKEEQDKVIANL